MRAKTINEVQNFERNQDPKYSMGVGQVNEIKKMLDPVYGNKKWMEYKIVSPDRIEISYKKEVIEKLPEEFDNRIWILQYEERERFFVREGKEQVSSFSHSLGNRYYWEIIEVTPIIPDDPNRCTFGENQLVEINKKPSSFEKLEIMAKALNEHYGKAKGFKYIGMEK